LGFSQFVDVDAGTNVAKEITIEGVSRNSCIINPAKLTSNTFYESNFRA